MRWAILVLAGVILASCNDKWGEIAPYSRFSEAPVELSVPSNAPFVGQQFLVGARPHLGIDFWAERMTPVMAAAPGTVTRALFDPAYGRRVAIDHGVDSEGQAVLTQYFHLAEIDVEVGDQVKRGQRIGALDLVSHFNVDFSQVKILGKHRLPL